MLTSIPSQPPSCAYAASYFLQHGKSDNVISHVEERTDDFKGKPRQLVRTCHLEDTKAYKSQQIGFIKDTPHNRSMRNIYIYFFKVRK